MNLSRLPADLALTTRLSDMEKGQLMKHSIPSVVPARNSSNPTGHGNGNGNGGIDDGCAGENNGVDKVALNESVEESQLQSESNHVAVHSRVNNKRGTEENS